MAAATITIKVKAGRKMMARIEEVCEHLEVTPAGFIEYAIESELEHQETHRIKETIALEEISSNVLQTGQALSFPLEEEDTQCGLCLKEIPARENVDGPVLCDECLSLAKGADFDGL